MRLIIISLAVLVATPAFADRDHDRDHRGGVVVKERVVVKPVVKERVVVRDHRYQGPIRANRRVIERRPVYVNNGRYVFANGRSFVYTRPIIRERYYNRSVRPVVLVEHYDPQPGYVWVAGSWGWGGSEWVWTGGHYEADASIRVYYDDGSWE
jgi:hypothetical protein